MKKLIKNTGILPTTVIGLQFLPNEYFDLSKVYWNKAAESAEMVALVTAGTFIVATESGDLSTSDGLNYLINNILPSSGVKFSINKVTGDVDIPSVSQMLVHNELVDEVGGDLIINGELVIFDDRG